VNGARIRGGLTAFAFVAAMAMIVALIVGGTSKSAVAGDRGFTDITSVSASAAHLRFTLARVDGTEVAPNLPNLADRTITSSPLLLFLAATRASPMDYRAFLSTAKRAGYHVLALDYSNTGRSVQATCGRNSQCYTDVQLNRLTGQAPGRFSTVSMGDSIISRLTAALAYLRAADPAGGWNRYRHDGRIDWSRVVVAGHSQGGGESAFISHLHAVRGALMFSSPVETNHGVAASWMHSAGRTPASRLYSFASSNDVFFPKIRGSWRMLGMDALGAPQDVLGRSSFSSHELVTNRRLGSGMESHLATIMDDTPRRTDGNPVFHAVWTWMLGQIWRQSPGAAN
jgi:hypothetical protein